VRDVEALDAPRRPRQREALGDLVEQGSASASLPRREVAEAAALRSASSTSRARKARAW